jgi:hypothetical protein
MPQGISKMGSKKPRAIGAFLLPQKRVIMPRTPTIRCSNHSAGHTPHFIQARKAQEGDWLDAEVSYLGSDLFKLVLEDSRILMLHNHEPGRLIEHLEEYADWSIRYSIRYYLLGIDHLVDKSSLKATAMFSMSDRRIDSCA